MREKLTNAPTDDAAIETLRNRQVKNFLTLTMLSLGVAGDPDARRSSPDPRAATNF
jgi:pullulanase/glycogen debranching enzyme